MNILKRIWGLAQAGLKSYGPSSIKRLLWEKEYSGEKWVFAENSSSDCVYRHLEKHSAGGSILDLGCGSGNTANELSNEAYTKYLGVDISENCLNKARSRSQENGRGEKNHFASGDFMDFEAAEKFDVILFRESMYHIPMGKIRSTLDHYSKFLKSSGLFIVRMGTVESDGTKKTRPIAMFDIILTEFDVVENSHYPESGGTVVVFRPKESPKNPSGPNGR